jgi:hypothetical protein
MISRGSGTAENPRARVRPGALSTLRDSGGRRPEKRLYILADIDKIRPFVGMFVDRL